MAKTMALAFGIIYTIVGVLGFLPFAGGTFGMTPAPLLGLFYINLAHNIVHLVIGVSGLLMAGTEESAAGYLRLFGIILLVIGILGFISPVETRIASFLPIGGWDRWLHIVSGVIMLWGASTSVKAPQPA